MLAIYYQNEKQTRVSQWGWQSSNIQYAIITRLKKQVFQKGHVLSIYPIAESQIA